MCGEFIVQYVFLWVKFEQCVDDVGLVVGELVFFGQVDLCQIGEMCVQICFVCGLCQCFDGGVIFGVLCVGCKMYFFGRGVDLVEVVYQCFVQVVELVVICIQYVCCLLLFKLQLLE